MSELLILNIVLIWLVIFFLTLVSLRVTTIVNRIKELSEQRNPLQLGTLAPDFQAKNIKGEKISLRDFENSSVLLVFLTSTCSGCRTAIPILQRYAPEVKTNANTQIVIVCESGEKAGRELVEEFSIRIPFLVSPRAKSQFVRIYNPQAITPFFCYIDKNRVLASRGLVGQKEWMQLEAEWQVQP